MEAIYLRRIVYSIPEHPITKECKNGVTFLTFCTQWHNFSDQSATVFLHYVEEFFTKCRVGVRKSTEVYCYPNSGKYPTEIKIGLVPIGTNADNTKAVSTSNAGVVGSAEFVAKMLNYIIERPVTEKPSYCSEDDFYDVKYLARELLKKVCVDGYTL